MSVLSGIFHAFRDALTLSRERYENLYTSRTENTREFYNQFLHQLICPWDQFFNNPNQRRIIKNQIERFFQTTEIDFVAIDGTCRKNPANDFILFFAGAYGAKGRISLQGDPPKIRYEKWELNRDVTMMAQVPVPLAEMSDMSSNDPRETFMVSDRERINLSSIHIYLMQLAEIFLAYNVANSSLIDAPKLLLIDQSLSSLMAATAMQPGAVNLVGYPYDRRNLDIFDITIALAHPFNVPLGIPSNKKFRQYTAIIACFHKANKRVLTIEELCQQLKLDEQELGPGLRYLEQHGIVTRNGNKINAMHDVKESWEYTVAFFNRLCTRLFIDKDQSALLYDVIDEESGEHRLRWLSPNDIMFLTAVGLRALIETCWEKKILLIGVVKDSESRYFSRNYLGVMKKTGLYPELADYDYGPLPWTDRILLETLPLIDDNLFAPWSTIEIDSTFMTLRLQDDGKGGRIEGVRGDIVATERLFARSLAQFYLNRSKANPLMGHVVFLDRLLYPAWDSVPQDSIVIIGKTIGQIRPFIHQDAATPNMGQAVMMYFLSTLTRNHFPEVIGYPEPLHKADWGAKTINRRIGRIIDSAELPFRNNAIYRTVRSIRDGMHRR